MTFDAAATGESRPGPPGRGTGARPPVSTGAGTAASVPLTALPGGTDPAAVADLLRALRRRLAGGDEVLLPRDPGVPDASALPAPPPAGTAVLLRTSGSTSGTGRVVALSAEALLASARATQERLGAGVWVLAVPVHHVAGLQVLVRSVVAGTDPVVVDTRHGFRPADLAAAVAALDPGVPGYLSLVPTQLLRVLDAGAEAVAPLRRLTAVLVGGAATAPAALARARAAGVPVVTTYGMTETGGGCVYDGEPLPGVRLRIGAGDRVEIAGPMLADSYLDDGPDPFVTEGGTRWLRTSDRGRLDHTAAGPRLTVLGRVDDVINTGGEKVSPAAVERVLPGVTVVGVPDPEWGELVTAVVAADGDAAPDLGGLRAAVSAALGGAHAPRALVVVDALPLRGPGKVDRAATARIARDALADPGRLGVQRYPAR